MKKNILRVMFSLFLIMVFVIGTYTLLSVKSYAKKADIDVSTSDPHPGSKWAVSHCGIDDGWGDYCAGVGTHNCCL